MGKTRTNEGRYQAARANDAMKDNPDICLFLVQKPKREIVIKGFEIYCEKIDGWVVGMLKRGR